jgi:hypothetical protein
LDNEVSVHLSQTIFAAHLVKFNNAHLHNITPDATPCCYGLPINAIPESDKDRNCHAFINRKRKF